MLSQAYTQKNSYTIKVNKGEITEIEFLDKVLSVIAEENVDVKSLGRFVFIKASKPTNVFVILDGYSVSLKVEIQKGSPIHYTLTPAEIEKEETTEIPVYSEIARLLAALYNNTSLPDYKPFTPKMKYKDNKVDKALVGRRYTGLRISLKKFCQPEDLYTPGVLAAATDSATSTGYVILVYIPKEIYKEMSHD